MSRSMRSRSFSWRSRVISEPWSADIGVTCDGAPCRRLLPDPVQPASQHRVAQTGLLRPRRERAAARHHQINRLAIALFSKLSKMADVDVPFDSCGLNEPPAGFIRRSFSIAGLGPSSAEQVSPPLASLGGAKIAIVDQWLVTKSPPAAACRGALCSDNPDQKLRWARSRKLKLS